MSILFSALSEVQFDLKGHGTVPILQLLVDRVPYNEFQLFRCPYACKLSEGRYRPYSKLEPEGFFYNDPLTGFASYVNQDYHLHRPSPSQLLEWNDTVRQCWQQHARHAERTLSDSGWVGSRTSICLQDLSNLYLPIFEQHTTGTMCLFTLSDLEKYELALRFLHPDRASHWWIWFRISGVTYKLCKDMRRMIGVQSGYGMPILLGPASTQTLTEKKIYRWLRETEAKSVSQGCLFC